MYDPLSDPRVDRAIREAVFDSDMRVRQKVDRVVVAILFYAALAALVVGAYFWVESLVS